MKDTLTDTGKIIAGCITLFFILILCTMVLIAMQPEVDLDLIDKTHNCQARYGKNYEFRDGRQYIMDYCIDLFTGEIKYY